MVNVGIALISTQSFSHEFISEHSVNSHLRLTFPLLCQLHGNIKHLLRRCNGVHNPVFKSLWRLVSVSLK